MAELPEHEKIYPQGFQYLSGVSLFNIPRVKPCADASLHLTLECTMTSLTRKRVTYAGGGKNEPLGGEGSLVQLQPRDKKTNTTKVGYHAPFLARSALCVLAVLSFVLTCHGRPDTSSVRHNDLVQPHDAARWAQHTAFILPGRSSWSHRNTRSGIKIGECVGKVLGA